MSIVALAVLVVTGVRSAYTYSSGIPDGQYGLVLVVKLWFVLGAIAFGSVHLLRRRNGRRLGWTVYVEALILVLTLVAGGVLATIYPG